MVHSLASKLLIIGKHGFIGRHFLKRYPDALALGRKEFDLSNPILNFSTEGIEYAIIAAGMGNPRICEAHPHESYQINVISPLMVGKELVKRGVLPIFFSTDYVYNDALEVAPLNLYGKQKAELEKEGEQLGALIIRLSKVYGIEKGDQSLFDEMASLLNEGKRIRAAKDQIFSPVYVEDVVQRIIDLAQNKERGIVSIVGPSYASRWEMALRIAEMLGVSPDLVEAISLDDLGDGVCRPKQLKLKGDFPALSWEQASKLVVKNYLSSDARRLGPQGPSLLASEDKKSTYHTHMLNGSTYSSLYVEKEGKRRHIS